MKVCAAGNGGYFPASPDADFLGNTGMTRKKIFHAFFSVPVPDILIAPDPADYP